jgi:hypothetical protein
MDGKHRTEKHTITKADEPFVITDPNTGRSVKVEHPPTNERDLELGRFIDAYGRLESVIFLVFASMLGIGFIEARDIFENNLDGPSLRSAISSLSRSRLESAAVGDLDRILDRVRTHATKRNHVIHGNWTLDMKFDVGPTLKSAEWIRVYQPTDPAHREDLESKRPSAKIKAKYHFSITDLKRVTHEVQAIINDLAAFYEAHLEHFVPPAKSL